MSLLRKLWNDEAGFIISTELVLVATIVVIGLIVGLVCVRNQVVQELVDIGQSIGNLCQGYAFTGIAKAGCAYTNGGCYNDVRDFCQESVKQVAGGSPGGISIATTDILINGVAPINETGVPAQGTTFN